MTPSSRSTPWKTIFSSWLRKSGDNYLDARRPARSAIRTAYDKKIKEYQENSARYEAEKKDIEIKARELEVQRDVAKKHGRPFGIAVIFLQVAILLNSIAGLLKAKRIWWLSVPVGLTGLVFFADGFLSIF